MPNGNYHAQKHSGYKLRHAKTKGRDGEARDSHALTVPPILADRIPERTRFSVELTEDGVLFRRIEEKPVAAEPTWIK